MRGETTAGVIPGTMVPGTTTVVGEIHGTTVGETTVGAMAWAT